MGPFGGGCEGLLVSRLGGLLMAWEIRLPASPHGAPHGAGTGSSSTPASHGLLSRLLKATVTQPGLEKTVAPKTRGSHRTLWKGGLRLRLSGALLPVCRVVCV